MENQEQGKGMKRGNIVMLLLVAFGLMIGFTFFFLNSLSNQVSMYTDFVNAKNSGKSVHVVGEWVDRDNSAYDPSQDLFRFMMKDTTNVTEEVWYYEPKPVNFEQAEKVVVIGKYEEDHFVADKILMKCPSKYESHEELIDASSGGMMGQPKEK